MSRTQLLQEVRKVQFLEVLSIWTEGRMGQEEAARMLGVCSRTFRRYIERYHEAGLEGLADKRLSQASARKAPVDESWPCSSATSPVPGLEREAFPFLVSPRGRQRSYTWVKSQLQDAGDLPRPRAGEPIGAGAIVPRCRG